MRTTIIRTLVSVVVLSLLAACAPSAPTSAPSAPTSAAPAAATKAPAAASPAAAPKPAASTATPAANVKRGGTLRAMQQNDWATMDPHTSEAIGYSGELIFDALLDYHMTPDGKFLLDPWLANSWNVNGREYTFKLEKGVKFHDGTDLTADVVKFNLERLRDDPKSKGKAYLSGIEKVEAVDPLTVKVTMKAPWAALLAFLTAYPSDAKPYMVSKAAIDKYGADFGTRPENTVGSGPMKLVSWLKSSNQSLERFDGYWKMGVDGKPLPYYDKATFRYIADTSIAMVEMKAGTLDYQERIDGKDVASVKANPDLVFHELKWDGTIYSLGINPYVAPFDTKKQLRAALRYAVDYNNLAQVIGEGIAVPYYYWWSEGTIGYDASLPKYTFDVAKAKQAMTEAGYPNGADVVLATIARPQDQRMAQVLKQMWDAAGLRTTIDSMERLAWVAAARARTIQITTFRAHLHPDPDMMGSQMITDGFSNWFNWSDPNMDKCMEDGRTTQGEGQRAEIYKRCQKILFDEAVYGPLFNWKHNDVTTKRVHGWEDNWEWPRFKRLWLDQ